MYTQNSVISHVQNINWLRHSSVHSARTCLCQYRLARDWKFEVNKTKRDNIIFTGNIKVLIRLCRSLFEKPPWCSCYATHLVNQCREFDPGFSSLSDETLNQEPVSV